MAGAGAKQRGSSRKGGSRRPEDRSGALAASRASVSWGPPSMRASSPLRASKAEVKAAAILQERVPDGVSADEDRAWELLLRIAGAQAGGSTPDARRELRRLGDEGRRLLEAR
mmetsp:Transcript_13763/g.39634  ORF Transcript_13763/g.39634 Transcript_13763/m.39634 type:complete len:113 (-) Transcript_13763:140-478(-)